jgi:hypothetical protein
MEDDHSFLQSKQAFYFLMEDNLNLFNNGRRPQSFWNWKTTSIILKMEDNLYFSTMEKMENDLNFKVNERWWPQIEYHHSFLQSKAGLASSSFTWAWHSSAPSCFRQFIGSKAWFLDRSKISAALLRMHFFYNLEGGRVAKWGFWTLFQGVDGGQIGIVGFLRGI